MSKPSQERRRYKSQTNSCSELKPLIEEFANHVERGADIEAGNSFRGLLTALGELLNSFKEIKKTGYADSHALCGGRPQKVKFPLCLKIT